MKFDQIDFKLISMLQKGFPLTLKPYREYGKNIGISENDVILRIKKLFDSRYIRYIGPLINTRILGFDSALIAMKVGQRSLSRAVEIINSHPGVSHNYARDHSFNIWFTLCCPNDIDFNRTVQILSEYCRADKFIVLPSVKTYKLRVYLDPEKKTEDIFNNRNTNLPSKGNGWNPRFLENAKNPIRVSVIQKRLLSALQKGVPVVPQPFHTISREIGISPKGVIGEINHLTDIRVIRRFGAVVHHRKLGYKYNAMVVLKSPLECIDANGETIASYREVSHCYQRKTTPEWLYNLYAMIHAHSNEELDLIVDEIKGRIDIKDYLILVSTEEYKKERVKYFSREFYKWENTILNSKVKKDQC